MFTILYNATNDNYDAITKADEKASFVMPYPLTEKNKIIKSVKNNAKKQAIVLEINENFMNRAIIASLSVQLIKDNFEEVAEMELKYVLLGGSVLSNVKVRNFMREFERCGIVALTNSNFAQNVSINVDISAVSFSEIIFVDYANFDSRARKNLSDRIKRQKNLGKKGKSLKKYLSEYSELITESAVTDQPPVASADRGPSRHQPSLKLASGPSMPESPRPQQLSAPRQSNIRFNQFECNTGSIDSSESSGGLESIRKPSGDLKCDIPIVKTIKRVKGSRPRAINTYVHPNNFTFLFRGIEHYQALKNGYHQGAALIITKHESEVEGFSRIVREAVNDGRKFALLIEAEDVEILSRARNVGDKVREYLNLIPDDHSRKMFIFADDSLVDERILEAFREQNALEIYAASYWNPEESTLPRNFVIVDLETKPGKVLRDLDSILEEKELTPTSFSECIDPLFGNAYNNNNLTEIQKYENFRRDLEATFVRFGTINLNINRERLFNESFDSLQYISDADLRSKRFRVNFIGENGCDVGGLAKDWFENFTKSFFNPDYGFFKASESNANAFRPFEANEFDLRNLTFVGKIIGKGVIEQMLLPCHFTNSFYKIILGKKPNLVDLKEVDQELYQSLCWMADNDVTDVMEGTTFTVDVEEFGARQAIPLKEGGADILLTEDNKFEYIRLMTEYKLETMIRNQSNYFLQGFNRMVPANLLSGFTVSEFKRLLSGVIKIDVDDWKNNVIILTYNPTDLIITWFWRAIESYSEEEKRCVLRFVTGSPSVPISGFSGLSVRGVPTRFTIAKSFRDMGSLPLSHTCYNQIDLPEYSSYEDLRRKLLTASTEGAGAFENS